MANPSNRLLLLDEPSLQFGHNQTEVYAKDGLLLFGPPSDLGQPERIRYGLVGTERGLRLFKKWHRSVQGMIPAKDPNKQHFQYWPGFSAVFGASWPETPLAEYDVDERALRDAIRTKDRHHAIYNAVTLVEEKIVRHCREEERQPQMWFVVIPDEVFRYGRPKSSVPTLLQIPSNAAIGKEAAIRYQYEGDLFNDYSDQVRMYRFDPDFHAQLKARLLKWAVVQVVRESTLTGGEYEEEGQVRSRAMQDRATTAWNLCTTAYFKAEGSPWRLANVRDGVCYVGLTYKIDDTAASRENVCCGAQMFLDSGDGVVFRGAMGPWLSRDNKEFHLGREAAADLMHTVVESFRAKRGYAPSEIFVHGQTNFSFDEWEGFKEGVPSGTRVFTVKIRYSNRLKMYRAGTRPVVRGSAWVVDGRRGFLWTNGYVPRLATYPGWEVPNPLEILVQHGGADITAVLKDVLGLTKLNYNACQYGDGSPVTLKFANMVGNVLTATPEKDHPPLPFRYYI